MEALAFDGFGGTGSIRELPAPEPAADQVLIRVGAAGLNPFDNTVIKGVLKDAMEHRFPLVPGMDASGTVEAVGEGVSAYAVGDGVFGSVGKPYFGEGTLAELATMSTETIARKPDAVQHQVAAAIPVAAVAALTMVEAMAPEKGTVVVAIGATGGVGSYLVQLATLRGAHVIAVCSAENAAYARTIGAAEVVDYADDVVEAVRARSPEIDAIADMHGDKDTVSGIGELVREGGHVASSVGAADTESLSRRGIGASNVQGRVTTSALEMLVSMVERDEIIAPPIHPFPLSEAARALEKVGSGHVRGKVVVVLD